MHSFGSCIGACFEGCMDMDMPRMDSMLQVLLRLSRKSYNMRRHRSRKLFQKRLLIHKQRLKDIKLKWALADILLLEQLQCLARSKREVLTCSRPPHMYFLDHMCTKYDDVEWMEHFRMTRATFNHLCELLKPELVKDVTNIHKAIPVNIRVAVAIHKLATIRGYRTLSRMFGVARTTVCKFVHEVCHAIVKVMFKDTIHMPQQGLELQKNLDSFETQFGFPCCAGVIDAMHIPVIAPDGMAADYMNSEGWLSVVLQGVVDHNGHFLDVNVGHPGKARKVQVLLSSSLYQRGNSGTLLPQYKREILGKEIPVLLLGDSTYPLKQWLMKPFKGHLMVAQSNFNKRLCKARMVSEMAFDRLKARWGCLLRRNNVEIEFVPVMVTACCILHNFCEKMDNDTVNPDWLKALQKDARMFPQPESQVTAAQSDNKAEEDRACLMGFFEHDRDDSGDTWRNSDHTYTNW